MAQIALGARAASGDLTPHERFVPHRRPLGQPCTRKPTLLATSSGPGRHNASRRRKYEHAWCPKRPMTSRSRAGSSRFTRVRDVTPFMDPQHLVCDVPIRAASIQSWHTGLGQHHGDVCVPRPRVAAGGDRVGAGVSLTDYAATRVRYAAASAPLPATAPPVTRNVFNMRAFTTCASMLAGTLVPRSV